MTLPVPSLSTAPVLFAFFSHPAMLGWLAAAAVPLVIHLLNKRKHREVPWAAMLYLMAALRRNARRMRIEQWLLLAVRTMIIVLVVMAVAEPLLEQAGLTFVSGQRTHKMLVIDGSYSMAYKPDDKSHFTRAKELAARIVDESNQGDGFTLVLLSDPPRVVVGTPAFDPSEFLEELEHLSLPHTGADLPATLVKVEEVLTAARRDHARLSRHEVILITDLGANTWRPEMAAEAAAQFRRRCESVASAASIVVADLGTAGAENLAVGSLRSMDAYATVARDVTFEAEVRNFGRQSRNRHLVEMFVDGRRAGEDYVDLVAGGSATASFSYRFDKAGEHMFEAVVAGDFLDIDNHRWLAQNVVTQLRVLCVDGKPGGTFEGSTGYLVIAMAPQGEVSESAEVRPEVVPESALVQLNLDEYDAIFLSNVGQFTSNEAHVLEAYVRGGGGLVFFLGDQVRPESYNRFLTAESAEGARLLPARLDQRISRDEPFYFDPLGYQHPLVAPFRSLERTGLLTAPIYQYYRAAGTAPEARVALAFEGGDPAIIEQAVGRGRTVLVTTSADTSWTTLPMWPSYVPIVRELVSLAVQPTSDPRNRTVGEPLSGAVRTLANDTPLSLVAPGGEKLTLRLAPDGEHSVWTYAETLISGAYRAEFAAPISRIENFAVNVDTAESDLSRVELAELKSEVWSGIPFEPFAWGNQDSAPSGPIVRHNSLHHWLLLAVLVLLLTESCLACHLGRKAG